MIPTELLQAFIIAVGNFSGILAGYYLLDRRIEGKILKYWRRIKGSEEGQDLFVILRELRDLLKSEEPQKLLKEATEMVTEIRVIVKKMSERLEPSSEENDDEPLEFPHLAKP